MADEKKPLDVGDAASVKELAKEAKSIAERQKEAVLVFMSSIDGRKWFYDLLVMCHLYVNPFSKDALIMAHNCGEMNIGQYVLAQINAATPELYLQMLKENANV